MRTRFQAWSAIPHQDIAWNIGSLPTPCSSMTLLSRIFGTHPPGISLDLARPHWEARGETDFPCLLSALQDLLPEDCTLYLEGGSPEGELLQFLQTHALPGRIQIAPGSIGSKPRVFHLPATPEILDRLAGLARSCAAPELAVHFHVYRRQTVLLEWHDAFSQPVLLSEELSRENIKHFARKLGFACERVEPPSSSK